MARFTQRLEAVCKIAQVSATIDCMSRASGGSADPLHRIHQTAADRIYHNPHSDNARIAQSGSIVTPMLSSNKHLKAIRQHDSLMVLVPAK